jgi:hypothetical protein
MNQNLEAELERLTANSAFRREDLLRSALISARRKKFLNVVGGVLALSSAATITGILSKAFGPEGLNALAAFIALVSGAISLVATSYYGDDEIFSRLSGSAKYLALRDAVYRLAIAVDVPDQQRLHELAELQQDYSDLDAAYSKYFTLIIEPPTLATKSSYSRIPPLLRLGRLISRSTWESARMKRPSSFDREAVEADLEVLHRKLEQEIRLKPNKSLEATPGSFVAYLSVGGGALQFQR